MKYIGLLDCNNFFVSCERLFRPDLAKKPVAVLSSNDGCIVARSQEVKAMGIPMGLPLFQVKQLVDINAITLFSSNFTLYRDISARVMQTLKDEVGDCHVYSIDEAFFGLDTTSESELHELRARIIQKTGIPVSIGVAATKTLAKVGSEFGKKGTGVCLLEAALWEEAATKVPCNDIWGLGRATTGKLTEMGVTTAAEFMALPRRLVRQKFGVAGERIYDELAGVRVYALTDDAADPQQSITSSRSFAQTTNQLLELESAVSYHVDHVGAKLRDRGLKATMMYVVLQASRHSDFALRRGGGEVVLDAPINSTPELTKLALARVRDTYDKEVPYKKAGVILAGLIPAQYTSRSLFATTEKSRPDVSSVLDVIQKRFGFDALHSAAILNSRDRSNRQMRSKAYTTAWKDIPTVQA